MPEYNSFGENLYKMNLKTNFEYKYVCTQSPCILPFVAL